MCYYCDLPSHIDRMPYRSSGASRFLTTRDWQTLRLLLPFTIEFKIRFVFCLFCLVLIQGANLLVPALSGAIVDALNNANSIPEVGLYAAIPLALLLCFVFVRFSALAFAEIQNAIFGTITVRATRRLSMKLLAHLHTLDVEYHLSRKTGGLTRDMDPRHHGTNVTVALVHVHPHRNDYFERRRHGNLSAVVRIYLRHHRGNRCDVLCRVHRQGNELAYTHYS